MEQRKMMSEIQREDVKVPLQGLSFPKLRAIHMKYREKFELPDQFLRACTLREGTWVVVLVLNCVALAVIGYVGACLTIMREKVDHWWLARFRNDFDYYYQKENQDLIERLWPLWVPFAQAIIGAKAFYFFTGMLVFYALVKKTVHPCWYVPWIIMTGLFVGIMWLMAFVMSIGVFVLLAFRPITVTWDICPIALICVYNYIWSYTLFVVVAHYKRRCIVKYWRDRGVQLGTNFLG